MFKILPRPLRAFTDSGRSLRKFSGVEAHREIPQALHRTGRLLQPLLREIELTPVGDRGEQKTNGRWLVTFSQQIAQGIKIAQRLGHLLRIDQKMLGVKPVTHKGLSGGSLRLCDLILVMWKGKVHAAGMNVDGLSQILHGHGRTLNVPAGTAGTDSRFPEKLTRFGRFPEG